LSGRRSHNDGGEETDRWEDHDDDLAYVRANEADPLRLDYLSATWSIDRLSNGLVAVGTLREGIPRSNRESAP
jgi:hypothetical protein